MSKRLEKRAREMRKMLGPEANMRVLYHIWLWLGDAANGRLRQLPAGTHVPGAPGMPLSKTGFLAAADGVEMAIRAQPSSALKEDVLTDIERYTPGGSKRVR